MTNAANVRSYCNPWPRYSADAQTALLTGEVYVETKSGRVIDALIRSVRPGDVVELVELGLLAPIKATPAQRRRLLAQRVEAIRARGGSIRELATGHESGDALPSMIIRAAEFIATSGRLAAKREGRGKPPIVLSPEDREAALGIWTSRRYTNSKDRLAAIKERLGRGLGNGWCYLHFGPPSGGGEKT